MDCLLHFRSLPERLSASKPDGIPQRRHSQDEQPSVRHSEGKRDRPAAKPVVLPVRKEASGERGRRLFDPTGQGSEDQHERHHQPFVIPGDPRSHRSSLVHTPYGENIFDG